MKAKVEETEVFVKHVSEDGKYALVSKDETFQTGIFKTDVSNLSGLNKKEINKLKKFKK